MRAGQPYNMATAEFVHDGQVAQITGTAETDQEDAI
jgi:hypothetical protein